MYRHLTLDGPYRRYSRYPRWEDWADRVIWLVVGAAITAAVFWL